MYGILGMPSKKIDQLVFGDFLKVKDRIIAKDKELQELNNRAAGEVVIREALSELRLVVDDDEVREVLDHCLVLGIHSRSDGLQHLGRHYQPQHVHVGKPILRRY